MILTHMSTLWLGLELICISGKSLVGKKSFEVVSHLSDEAGPLISLAPFFKRLQRQYVLNLPVVHMAG